MDKTSANIEFEINRDQLTRYWRAASWFPLLLLAFFLGGMAILTSLVEALEAEGELQADLIPLVLKRVGFLIAIVVAVYFLRCHLSSERNAQNLRFAVEGDYLCLSTGWLFRKDQKIHFRAISDYSRVDGPLLRWFGLEAVSFTIIGSPQGRPTLVPGVVDAEKVRNLLCEVDAEREGG